MNQFMVAAGLAALSGFAFGQDQRVLSPSEQLEAALADLRGLRDGLGGTVRVAPESWPFGLRPPGTEAGPAGVVSVAALSHRVPRAAEKAYDRGVRFSLKDDVGRAVQEFEKAVALDPEYADAHRQLGVEYLRLGRLSESEAELRRSIELDPYVSIVHSNLGWALFQQRRFPEAERYARSALARSSGNDRAHLLLGLLLGAALDTRAEGVRHLELATRTFPEARRIVEELQPTY